ncbi:MAG TPA: hypothetical protein DEP45_13000 [Armatimonadetes bacterium]|nr:hypothetical protein [Armatimonadota bacterium]
MRIDVSDLQPHRCALPDGARARSRAAEPAASQAPDIVSVSEDARLLAAARAALRDAPDVREHAVEQARARLSTGAAAYAGRDLARAIIVAATSAAKG